jgi:hypothetical protein
MHSTTRSASLTDSVAGNVDLTPDEKVVHVGRADDEARTRTRGQVACFELSFANPSNHSFRSAAKDFANLLWSVYDHARLSDTDLPKLPATWLPVADLSERVTLACTGGTRSSCTKSR